MHGHRLTVSFILILSAYACTVSGALLDKRFGGVPPCSDQGLARRGGCIPSVTQQNNPPIATNAVPPIDYNGYGPVMANGVNIYSIFYGTFSNATIGIIGKFLSGLGGSTWWKTVQQYYEADSSAFNGQRHVSATVNYMGYYRDVGSQTTDISGKVTNIVSGAIDAAGWPADPGAIYLVLTSGEIKEGGLCTQYCGYHSSYTYGAGAAGVGGNVRPPGAGLSPRSGINVKYALIGDGSSCPGTLADPATKKSKPGCLPVFYRNLTHPTSSINRDQIADSIINVVSHEVAEAATDSSGGTWVDRSGEENADKCNFYFLDVVGSQADAYNVDFGVNGRYLIQSMWSPVLQRCVQSS